MKPTVKSAPEVVELDVKTVKQMIALYQAVNTARETYKGGGTAYKLQMDLISASADAKNVKTAFERAAEAINNAS